DETLADEVLPDLQRWPLERSHQRRSGLFGGAPLIVHGLDLQLDVRAEHAQNAISMRYRYLDVRLPMELRAGIDRGSLYESGTYTVVSDRRDVHAIVEDEAIQVAALQVDVRSTVARQRTPGRLVD